MAEGGTEKVNHVSGVLEFGEKYCKLDSLCCDCFEALIGQQASCRG